MSVPLTDFTGKAIYLDTMLPYMLLRGIDLSIKPFLKRIERGEILAYTSVLTFDELAYRLLLACVKDHYNGSPIEQLRSEDEKMMAEFAPVVADLLRRLRGLPHLIILDVLALDLDMMAAAMLQYHLRPRDALHWAAMQRVGCFDLASNDHHFDRIPHLRRFVF